MSNLTQRFDMRLLCGFMLLTLLPNASPGQASPERGIFLIRRTGDGTPPPPPPSGPPPAGLRPPSGPPPGARASSARSDTVMIDRFERMGDTLRGRLDVIEEGAHIDYMALLGPDNTIRLLLERVFVGNAGDPNVPIRQTRIEIVRDSMIVTSGSVVKRLPASAGVIPMFPSALALNELLTRRAQAHGGTADIPVFWIRSGETIPSTVRRISGDSLVVSIFGEPLRARVDSTGRILGGASPSPGARFEWFRGTPDSKMGLIKSMRDSTLKPAQ